MPKATWHGVLLAESDRCETVDGNLYFPPDALRMECFRETDTRSVCPVKGEASYFDIVVEGKVNKDAAWYYSAPKPAAAKIRGYVAFWKGVKVER